MTGVVASLVAAMDANIHIILWKNNEIDGFTFKSVVNFGKW